MRAVLIHTPGQSPTVGEHPDPEAGEGKQQLVGRALLDLRLERREVSREELRELLIKALTGTVTAAAQHYAVR